MLVLPRLQNCSGQFLIINPFLLDTLAHACNASTLEAAGAAGCSPFQGEHCVWTPLCGSRVPSVQRSREHVCPHLGADAQDTESLTVTLSRLGLSSLSRACTAR